MPRLKRYVCEFGDAPHDEAFICQECWRPVCGYHAERSTVDEDWLCPPCYAAETARLAEPVASSRTRGPDAG